MPNASPSLEPQSIEKEELRRTIRGLGADLAGFVACAELESACPEAVRPSTLSGAMSTFVVFAKRTLHGVVWSRHLPTKQLAGGRTLRALDAIAGRLSEWLEARGHASLPVSAAALDFDRRPPEDLTPAGQGSSLLRIAAVEAGLGTWGLNMMVLTPQYGPRVYFGGLMTRLRLTSDPKLGAELCPGLEACGRCAAVCPEDAIPRSARAAAPLAEYRGLDAAACARSCQPFGFRTFVEHVAGILQTLDGQEMWDRMRGRKSGEVWSEMAMMKEAAITGCSECTQVCPVGDDFPTVMKSPHRRTDLPESLPRTCEDGLVRVAHIGPQKRRSTTWNLETPK